eukprot:4367694-Prymnesium_polylepis.1
MVAVEGRPAIDYDFEHTIVGTPVGGLMPRSLGRAETPSQSQRQAQQRPSEYAGSLRPFTTQSVFYDPRPQGLGSLLLPEPHPSPVRQCRPLPATHPTWQQSKSLPTTPRATTRRESLLDSPDADPQPRRLQPRALDDRPVLGRLSGFEDEGSALGRLEELKEERQMRATLLETASVPRGNFHPLARGWEELHTTSDWRSLPLVTDRPYSCLLYTSDAADDM